MHHSFAMTRTERTYYVVFGGYTLAQFFIAPVYPLFLLSRGLDLFQMNAFLATYLITVFVFEVPTGALAGVAAVRRAPVLRLLCALALTAAFAGFPLYILWQPRLQPLVGGGLWPMGWILALINVAGLTGGALVPRLLRRFEREVVLAAAALWRSTMLVVAATAT